MVRSCESLFRKLFLLRCSPHLSHRDWADAAPLNSICYMWLDIMPVYVGPVLRDRQALHEAALSTMAGVLELSLARRAPYMVSATGTAVFRRRQRR